MKYIINVIDKGRSRFLWYLEYNFRQFAHKIYTKDKTILAYVRSFVLQSADSGICNSRILVTFLMSSRTTVTDAPVSLFSL